MLFCSGNYLWSRWLCSLTVAVALLGQPPAKAQSSADPADQRIDDLQKRIEELEAELKQMQKPTPPPAPPQVEPSTQPDPQTVDTPPDQGIHSLGPVRFSGFTDFGYGRAVFSQLPPSGINGSPNGFGIGDFDLFTNTQIAEHWSLLAEVLVTSDFSNEVSADLDRLLLSYKPSEYFSLGVGKFNTAIGYYPNAFHRARYFQVATGRPLMYADEDDGGILPLHSLGVTATGKINSGSLGLHWTAEVANGFGSNTPATFPIQNFADENNGKSVDFALFAKPDWLSGFEAGASVYHDTLHPVNIGAVHQLITAAHIVYVGSKFDWLNEAAVIRHSLDNGGGTFRSLTSYTEISRAFGRTRPFFRFDYQNVPKTDPVFAQLGRRSGPSVGVNRRLSNFVVLKVQYGKLGQRDLPSVNDFQAQLAIAF